MADESNAGPFKVGVDGEIEPGETHTIELSEVKAGPSNKRGYLRKVFGTAGGMDYVYIVNASPALVAVATSGSSSTVVPSATSQNLDSGPYRSVKVTNKGANAINTSDSDQIAVEVGNGPRSTGKETWSAKDAINDVIPGAQF